MKNIYGTSFPLIFVYPYNSDGISAQAGGLSGYAHPDCNYINVTPLLPRMNGFGFIKFRITATQPSFDVSEAYFTVLADNREIYVNPLSLDFGSVSIGDKPIINLTVAKGSSRDLFIYEITKPSQPFSIVSDGCSGENISDYCTVAVQFAPAATGAFISALKIISNDGDKPSVTVNLSGTGIKTPATLTGKVTDLNTGLLLSNVTVSVTDFLKTSSTLTDSNGNYTVTDLVKGSYTAVFEKTAHIQQSINGTLTTGQNTLNITLSPLPATLTGTVTDSSTGLPLSNVAVTITDPVGSHSTLTDFNGKYTVTGLIAGSFTATFEKSGYIKQTPNGILTSGQTLNLNVQLTVLPLLTIAITSPQNGASVNSSAIAVTGSVSNNADVSVNGIIASRSGNTFTASVPLVEGLNTITAMATDQYGQIASQSITVTLVLPTPPQITNISVNNITADSANISWTTDQPSDSSVDYGQTTAYGSTASDAGLVTSHTITLNNLIPDKTYHFKVASKNASNYSSLSGDRIFTTLKFRATNIGDYGNVTVIEVKGNYDVKNPDGSTNYLPRQEIAKEFYRTRNDEYDFFVVFSNFNFQMPETDARGFYLEVRNDIQGIGKRLFDDSPFYGSNGKLQGMIDMGNMANHGTNPLDPKLEDTLTTLAHEQVHRWGSSVKFRDSNNNLNSALIGKDGVHWSYLFDSDGSLMYGNDWKDNGNGTFTSVSGAKYYSPLDLYLMGIYDKAQVPQMLLIDNPIIDPTKLPEIGATISGTAKFVTIDNIIAAEGERIPNASSSQKSFKTAFIFITTPGTFNSNVLPAIETIRIAWAGRFTELTHGKGTIMDIAPSITLSIGSPLEGETINGSDVIVKGSVINTTGKETGVTVNGIPATVYGNQFIANNILLTEGANTITATATDTAGTTATTSRTVNAVTTGDYIRLSSNIESGILPLKVYLRIDGSFSITNSNLNITGPVQPTILSSSPDEYRVTFIAEGIYYITASTTSPDNNVYQDSISIIVLNKNQLDTLLKAKWEGMKGALANQNIIGALNYFLESSKEEYNEIFTALHSNLSSLSSAMREIIMSDATGNIVEYYIKRFQREVDISYFIYFMRDEKGLWRIVQF